MCDKKMVGEIPKVVETNISSNELPDAESRKLILIKKLEIKNIANELTYDDRLYVLQILKQHLHVKKIIEHADGCRINLDCLNDDIINKIHYIIKTKLTISHSNKIY
jgi:hypothetical protein